MQKILLVYPPLGFVGSYVIHPPLSLVYLASQCVKNGINVEIFDCRIIRGWHQKLIGKIDCLKYFTYITILTKNEGCEGGCLINYIRVELNIST